MEVPRISASSYSNTAPLVWSFLYGRHHGDVEIILDNAPARSAALLGEGRVDAALVPVFAYQTLENVKLVPDVCVGAKERVRSVCLFTDGRELSGVTRVALDVSSRTSAALTKIIFREFIGRDPEFVDAEPDLDAMLERADCALVIGDPALKLSASKPESLRRYDLAEVWKEFTNKGFIFAMWMTRHGANPVDFAEARDEGCAHIPDIAANYSDEIGLTREQMTEYLSENITYEPDASMLEGLGLFFELAAKHGLVRENKPLEFV